MKNLLILLVCIILCTACGNFSMHFNDGLKRDNGLENTARSFNSYSILRDKINKHAPFNDIVIKGNYMFIAAGISGLKIFDNTDPLNPLLLGSVRTTGIAKSLVLNGNSAFVHYEIFNKSYDDDNIDIIDITNVYSPQYISSITTPGNFNDMYVKDNYLYIADDSQGLLITNVSDIKNPGIIKTVTFSDEQVESVYVSGNYAYITTGSDGLKIINIDNKKNPVIINEIKDIGSLNKIIIQGNYAYVCVDSVGLQILDISDPENIILVKTVSHKNRIYAFCVLDNFAYICNKIGEMIVVDISNVQNSAIIETIELPGSSKALYATKQYIYFAKGNEGVFIFDKENIAIPATQFKTSFGSIDVDISKNYALNIGLWVDQVQIIDITNYEKTAIVSTMQLPDKPYASKIVNDYAFIACDDAGLVILDISEAANPKEVITVDLSNDVYDVSVSGNYAYVANSDSGLSVVDITNISESKVIKTNLTDTFFTGSVDKVFTYDNYCFAYEVLSKSDAQLQIIDISDKLAMHIVGAITLTDLSSLTIKDNYLFAADGKHGFKIFDLTEIAFPKLLHTVNTETDCVGVAVDNRYCYIVDRVAGLKIFDISDMTELDEVKSLAVTNEISDIAVSKNYIYVADEVEGLIIIGEK